LQQEGNEVAARHASIPREQGQKRLHECFSRIMPAAFSPTNSQITNRKSQILS
jgi:hypothetical protein